MNQPISSVVGGTRTELCDMPWDDYKAFPAINGSVLVKGRKSMLHLKHAWDKNGEDSDAMQYGRMVHCLLFEPREVSARYRAWDKRRAGNDYELFCAEAAAAGAEVVRATGQYSLESALTAVQGFLANKRVQALITAGKAEQSILCVENGIQCKGRLDWISTSEHVLTDLKTAAQVEPTLFGRSFFSFGYHIKLGLYRRWLDRVTGERWPVEVIVLESTEPHDVAVVPIPDAVLDDGVDKALEIMARVKTAIEADHWPGVAGDDFMALQVPYYAMAEETEEFQG